MRISTKTHAYLDFATAGFALAFPRVLGASDKFTKVTTAIAVGKIGYALLTRHELGVARVIPMKTHLALDAIGGAALCALPYLLDEEENAAVKACAVGLGAFDIAAAPLTDTRSLPPRMRGVVGSTTAQLPGESSRQGVVPRQRELPRASLIDSWRISSRVIAPTVAMGPIVRRPKVMALAETLGSANTAVKTMQAMRDKYGSGPLLVRVPLREQAVLLDGAHVRRLLDETPEPFATASVEKQAALAHFEPKGALISHGTERTVRRQLNEEVLEHTKAVHHMGEHLLPIVDQEAQALLERVRHEGHLHWSAFFESWFRLVRRVVFGNSARNDTRITDLMLKLRADGNWAFAKPICKDLREELHQRIGDYLRKREPGSLTSYMAARATAGSAPENQIPQWLFAFDPAAMSTYRALALLAAHPGELRRAREETVGGIAAERPHRPRLRACVLEALRLWPTTPLLLRQSTRETEWENGVMPPHTSILIYAPFFHRDETQVPFAHSFYPDVWMQDDPEVQGNMPRQWPFVPFSGGSGACPGRNLVLLLTSGMLAALVGDREIALHDPRRLPAGRLPGLLNNFSLRFDLRDVALGGRRAPQPAREHMGR